MTDIAEYEELVRESGAFRDIELSILKESLISWEDNPGGTVLDAAMGELYRDVLAAMGKTTAAPKSFYVK